MPPTPLDLLIDAGAAYRLTLLVTTDEITQPLRDRIAADAPDSFLDRLVNCPWCAGVWVGMGVAAARAIAPRPWSVAARGLALAGIASNAVARL